MIIKCPECGRQVSDKAPVCPTCGVEIAGKVCRCVHCGEIYFADQKVCPACHQINNSSVQAEPVRQQPVTPVASEPVRKPVQPEKPVEKPMADTTDASQPTPVQQPKKSNTSLVVAIIFAIIICGGMFYLYQSNQSNKEQEEYEFAMRSTDPEVLQQYLTLYADAPQEHRDSIEAHLLKLQKGDEEWQNAVLSNSRAALQQYLEQNPSSVHRQEALNKIDSLDWVVASHANTIEALNEYTSQHADGRYIDEAKEMLDKLKSTTLQPEEKEMIVKVFRQFFQSINSRDESRLEQTVGMVIDTFLGKSNATSADVLSFLNKLYKDNIANMNWHIDQNSYKIEKREVAENEFVYDVKFSARQEKDLKDGNKENVSFRISASVNNEGKISSFNMTKLVSE